MLKANYKKIILLILLVVLTGCNARCNVILSESGINSTCFLLVTYDEHFDNKVGYPSEDSKLNEIISNDEFLIYRNNDDKRYVRRTERESLEGYNYSLSYKYNYNELKYSTLFDCFDNTKYSYNGKQIYFQVTGKNKCNPDTNFELNVTIPFNVRNNNAHSVGNNNYKWEFKSGEDVNIMIDIGEEDVSSYYNDLNNQESKNKIISIELIVGAIILISAIAMLILLKRKKNNTL